VNVRLVLVGGTALAARIAKAGAVVQPTLAGALYEEATDIMAKAIPITPIEFGPLRASGRVEPPEVSGTSVSVTLGFGGAAAPYAVYVHERMDLSHKPPTQAKFLEQPVLEAQSGFGARLGARMELRI